MHLEFTMQPFPNRVQALFTISNYFTYRLNIPKRIVQCMS